MTTVRYFAAASEATGTAEEDRIETTLGELLGAISAEHPQLVGILPRCSVLVDGERRDDDAVLSADSVIDVLPPFAGG